MNYSEVSSRLQTWMENSGSEFTGEIDWIIDLAEQRISKDLDCDAMVEHKTSALTSDDEFISKPVDCVNVLSLMLNPVSGERSFLYHRTMEFCQSYAPNRSTSGTPVYYANWDEDTLFIVPTPDAAYPVEMAYAARITGLSSGTTTTWISTNHPDLLFYACALEAGVLEKATDDEERFLNIYSRALSTAQAEVERVRSDKNTVFK